MKKIFAAIVFTAISFYPYLARADTHPPVPDISGWTVINVSRIELRISDSSVAYIGLEVEYSNPANPREFIRVIRRHIPLILSKSKNQDGRLLSEATIMLHNQKEEQDRLNEVTNNSDPIVYVQWRTKSNSHTGTDMQDGDINVWFLRPNESWLLATNKQVEVEFLTENISNGKPHNVFSGMKYQIGNVYHIIRIDRNDLVRLFQAEEK